MSLTQRVTILVAVAISIPSILFASFFFTYMKNNIIDDERLSMAYLLRQQEIELGKNIESIYRTKRFFLGEYDLIQYLEKSKKDKVDTEDNFEFYHETIHTLERMINNNPDLYQVRVYIPHQNVPEMMPLLYYQERMNKLEWVEDRGYTGWKFDYIDKIFKTFENQDQLVGWVEPITSNSTGEMLGIIEITMSMETMFSFLYEGKEGYWSCFIDEEEKIYAKEEKIDQSYIKKFNINKGALDEHQSFYQEIGEKELIVGYLPIEEMSGGMVIVSDISHRITGIQNIKIVFITLSILIVGIFWGAMGYVTKRMFSKFYEVLHSIQEIQKGNLSLVIETEGTDEVSEMGEQINKMSRQIKTLMEENVHRQILIKNSEIKALQNQINAHFIYNVLESIKMMAEINEEYEISDATTALGKLLRYTMKWTSSHVMVKEEIEYIKNYLKLMNLRFDYEIRLELNVPEEILKQKIPKMSLQPLIENAICHGIEDLAENTTLYINGRIGEHLTKIEIIDLGKGMNEETLKKLRQKMGGELEHSGGRGNGIGLKNVQDRLKMSFGETYGLKIESKEMCYTKVSMTLPRIISERERWD